MVARIQTEIACFLNRNKMILNLPTQKTVPNRVNLHWWKMGNNRAPGGMENLGDYLSQVVVDHMLNVYGLSWDTDVGKTKHLYAVGSILAHGYQNATVWGSGLLNGNTKKARVCLHLQKLDVRAVRGPLTRDILLSNGQKCPEIYGDPAIILPEIYSPTSFEKKYEASVILHHTHGYDRSSIPNYCNNIEILTSDYKHFVDEICASNLIISSTLHGIILAESYGIPAILLADDGIDMFKYRDYYYGTGRPKIVVAQTVQEALSCDPLPVPDFTNQRCELEKAFPKDLWNTGA